MFRCVVCLCLGILAFAPTPVAAQQSPTPQVIRLWPDGAPGAGARRGQPEQAAEYWVKNVNDPTLTAFPADPRQKPSVSRGKSGLHRARCWLTAR